ncbi:MAG: DUF4010 domain-containing protein [Planctomycetota bacterium]
MVEAELSAVFYRYGVALAIGAMVGLERESSAQREAQRRAAARAAAGGAPGTDLSVACTSAEPPVAGEDPSASYAVGLRTTILLGLCGALAGHAGQLGATWVLAAALGVVGALLVTAYHDSVRRGDVGLTSEVSSVAVFLLGALCSYGRVDLAGPLGVVMTFTLALKEVLHRLARRIDAQDIQAALKFALLTVVILPLLPAEPLRLGDLVPQPRAAKRSAAAPSGGEAPVASASQAPVASGPQARGPASGATPTEMKPHEGGDSWWRDLSITPRKVWWMVILIGAVGFTGYVLGQTLGTRAGLLLTAVVGGMVSSTAVSLSYAERSKEQDELSPQLAMGILAANAVMPLRLLVMVAVIAPALARSLALPLLAMVAVAGVSTLFLARRHRERSELGAVPQRNPFEVGPALKFGLLFGVVLLVAQAAQQRFGQGGLYAVALLTGLTDVDAIGLATANLVADGDQAVLVGAVTIALAVLSNTCVKGFFVFSAGSPALRRLALTAFGLMGLAAAAGIGLLFFLS